MRACFVRNDDDVACGKRRHLSAHANIPAAFYDEMKLDDMTLGSVDVTAQRARRRRLDAPQGRALRVEEKGAAELDDTQQFGERVRDQRPAGRPIKHFGRSAKRTA